MLQIRNVTRRRDRLIVARLVLLLGLTRAIPGAPPAWSYVPQRAMRLEDVATTWVGVSEDRAYLLRLELYQDGTGVGGYLYSVDSYVHAGTFPIALWTYERGVDGPVSHIRIELPPEKGLRTWLGTLEGSVAGGEMRLTASGDGWVIDFTLLVEPQLEQAWQRLRRLMECQGSVRETVR